MSESRIELLKSRIRDIQDFPEPGVLFRDITPLLADPHAFNISLDLLAEQYDAAHLDTIIGIESRGFMFGAALAAMMRVSFVPARKPGKLPAPTYGVEYELEYGTDTLEMHRDALQRGSRVLIVDDLIATGGTAWAAAELAAKQGAAIVGLAFVLELTALGGRQRLEPHPVFSLLQY